MGLKKSFVGVDIGHANIKVVQVEPTAAGFRVAKYATLPTPPDSIRDGMVNNPEEVGQAIKQAVRDAHIHAGHAVIAAAGGAVFVRSVPFPKMTAQMLRDSVKFEAGRYIPGSVDDAFVEAEIVGPISETQMSVLLAAAPKDTVHGRMAACSVAGLDTEIVEIETFAAYRTLLEGDPSRDTTTLTYMLVDIGAANTTVSVIDKGVYVMHRSMPNGGNMLTDSLRQAFKLEHVDAEAGKTVLDLRESLTPGAVENPPLRVIQTQVDDLIRELRRSLNFLQTQAQTENSTPTVVNELILCGGGAKLKGLDQYIQAKLSLPTHTVGVFDNPLISQSGSIEGQGIDIAVAAGLAIRAHLKAA
jgi:type IV pilus assembly protein PilM